ncbi:hypothetical protein OC834_000276 [Tilletia horrida]|nr:hypothetical protein OC834_000276 [Tilletia horrida]
MPPSGAHRLASIYGTEADKVNCSFYSKIGACRHGDRCSRKHTKPAFSQTILVSNVYQNPRHADPNCTISDADLQAQFDTFYEDFFCELAKYGDLIEMHVCDNVGDHLIGNVYARYEWEEHAQRAVNGLNDRWYNKLPLFAELSPVTDFREACCRQNETNECNRGGFCNFMHLRYPSPALLKELQHQLAVELRERKRNPQAYAPPAGNSQGGAAAAAGGGGGSGGGGGWKERLALEQGEEFGRGGSDWRSAPGSGADWRSGGGSGADWRNGGGEAAAAGYEGGADRRSASPVRR